MSARPLGIAVRLSLLPPCFVPSGEASFGTLCDLRKSSDNLLSKVKTEGGGGRESFVRHEPSWVLFPTT